MKRHLKALSVCALISACGGLLAASNEELLKSIPQSSGVTVAVDIAKFIELPLVKGARAKDPELEKQFKELETKLAAKKLTIRDMVSNFVAFSSDDPGQFGGLVASTNLGEANLEALLKGEIFNSPPSDYTVETIKGRKTYVIKGQKPALIPGQDALKQGIAGKQLENILGQSSDKTVALTFLAKDTLLIIERESLEKYLSAPKGLNAASAARSASIDSSAPLWGVFSMPRKTLTQTNNPAPNAFADRITGFAISLNAKSPAQDDLSVKACVECVDAPSAAMTCQQMQGLAMMMSLSGGQGGQPSPIAEALNSLVLDNKGKFISVDLTLTKKVIDSLGKKGRMPFAPQMGGLPMSPSNVP